MDNKPTIIIIPGSWHTAAHAQPLIDILSIKGYRASAHQLEQVGIKSDKRPMFQDDVNMISSLVCAELDAGRDVCLLAHSYAGMSVAETVNHLVADGRLERKEGKGSLVHIVFLAAYVFPAGFVLDARDFGREDGNFLVKDDGFNHMLNAGEVFFNDLGEAEAQPWVDRLEPAYYQERTPCLSSDNWRKAPITVIGCTKDNAIASEMQRTVWRGLGFEEQMLWLDAGHTPYVSQPQNVADLVVGVLEGRA